MAILHRAAPRAVADPDCLALFGEKLLASQWLDRATLDRIHQEAHAEADAAVAQAMREPRPRPEDTEKFTYAPSPVDKVYPDDYTGLPN